MTIMAAIKSLEAGIYQSLMLMPAEFRKEYHRCEKSVTSEVNAHED